MRITDDPIAGLVLITPSGAIWPLFMAQFMGLSLAQYASIIERQGEM